MYTFHVFYLFIYIHTRFLQSYTFFYLPIIPIFPPIYYLFIFPFLLFVHLPTYLLFVHLPLSIICSSFSIYFLFIFPHYIKNKNQSVVNISKLSKADMIQFGRIDVWRAIEIDIFIAHISTCRRVRS
jgi:hypothetical protein